MTALGGAPAAASWVTTTEGPERIGWSSARRALAARRAGHSPRTSTTANVASAPSRSTGASKAIPVEFSAIRASPRGAMGESKVATATAPTAPTRPITKVWAIPSATS